MAMDFTHVSSSLALHSLNHRHFQSKLVQHELLVLETFFPGRWPLRILFLQHRSCFVLGLIFIKIDVQILGQIKKKIIKNISISNEKKYQINVVEEFFSIIYVISIETYENEKNYTENLIIALFEIESDLIQSAI